VAWNLHAYDWLEQDSKWMAERLANRIQPGSIVLLHDAQCTKRHLSREPTLEAVDMLLNQSAPFCFANRLDSERGCTQNRYLVVGFYFFAQMWVLDNVILMCTLWFYCLSISHLGGRFLIL